MDAQVANWGLAFVTYLARHRPGLFDSFISRREDPIIDGPWRFAWFPAFGFRLGLQLPQNVDGTGPQRYIAPAAFGVRKRQYLSSPVDVAPARRG